MNRRDFITAARRELTERYEWARDEARLQRFIDALESTCGHGSRFVNIADSPALQAAWNSIGGAGKISYRKLWELEQ